MSHLHEEEDNLARNVAADTIHIHPPSPRDHICQFDIVHVSVQERLVDSFVILHSFLEVCKEGGISWPRLPQVKSKRIKELQQIS